MNNEQFQGEKVVWVDWILFAFEKERGTVKNLNYEEEIKKLNELKEQQLDEKKCQYSTNS
jgi:hypothetical protein